jgi:threonine/homoserine efflux transporter RhtA
MAILWNISVKNVPLRTALGLHFVGFIASAFANNEIDVDLGRFFTVKFCYFA